MLMLMMILSCIEQSYSVVVRARINDDSTYLTFRNPRDILVLKKSIAVHKFSLASQTFFIVQIVILREG
jgi:hypothetical protein